MPEARLLIVGGGDQYERLRSLAESTGVSNEVIFTGFASFDLVPDFIRLADLTLSTLRVSKATFEIIPAKVTQYLACGVPVLATRLGGMSAVLAGEECGVVYRPLQEFTEAIVELLSKPDYLRRLGRRASEHISKHHRWETIIDRLEEEFSQLCRGRA